MRSGRDMWKRLAQNNDRLLLCIEKQKSYVLTNMQSMTEQNNRIRYYSK